MCINVTLCLFPCNKNNSLPTSLGHHIFFLTEQVSSSKGLGVLGKGASKSLERPRPQSVRRQVDTVRSTLSCQTPWFGPRFFIQTSTVFEFSKVLLILSLPIIITNIWQRIPFKNTIVIDRKVKSVEG